MSLRKYWFSSLFCVAAVGTVPVKAALRHDLGTVTDSTGAVVPAPRYDHQHGLDAA